MPQTDVVRFATLVSRGLEAVGCRAEVAVEERCVVVRDLIVDMDSSIEIFRASNPSEAFRNYPLGAETSAATAVCSIIMTEMAARAIEKA